MSKLMMNMEESEQELNMWIIDVLKLIEHLTLQIKVTHPVSDKIKERKLKARHILMKM